MSARPPIADRRPPGPESAGGTVALEGMRALVERPGVLFIDQFGVLHDGSRPYPGAVDCLAALKARGARIVLLSNSGRTGGYNASRLEEIGFQRSLYDHFVTSGDVAFALLAGVGAIVPAGPATRCLTVSGIGDRNLANALGFSEAETGATADFVVIAGSRGDVVPLGTYRDLLAPAARRGVPAVCTNPDLVMLTKVGPRFGAGRIAELYAEMGGPVTYVGKPYPAVYAHAARVAGVEDPSTVLCVGDSLEHDIRGAAEFGARSALVRTGVNASLSDADLDRLIAAEGVAPDFLLPSFVW